MGNSTDLIYDTKRKMLSKYPRFGSEIAVANIEFKDDLPYHTAATDGKNVYVDPNYFASLSENDRLFLIAHEIMHIKFMHMYRLVDKDGKKRNMYLWNVATDAIINANLERDGFTIQKGAVNMPEALNYSAEEFYQKLLEEKEKKQNEQRSGQEKKQEDGQEQGQNSGQSEEQDGSQNQEQNGTQGNGQNNKENSNENQNVNQEYFQGDDHSLWEEAFKQQQEYKKEEKKQNSSPQKQEQQQEKQQDEASEEQTEIDFDEKEEFEKNRKEKREKFKARREKAQKDIRSTSEGTISLGNIGKSKNDIDWKVLLRREVEKTETIWSQRRSVAENNYAYRLEENDIEDEAETEVMIDVSGSVNLDLVKAFLRQIKPILKQSKLKVGCFNEKFWGLVDIKSEKDIDNFTIPKETRGHSAWTEDWDLAVRSFTKKREINKIVFTDGYPCPGTMPKEDLKKENVIWLVYGNKDFQPCCGKVINITEKQLEKLQEIDKWSSTDDISR